MPTQDQEINNLLTSGVEEIHVKEHLGQAFKSKKTLRVKHGIDPTGPLIHVGRAATLWKLREFQELGHQLVILIGDYTAQIGDPSDKLSKRPFLTKKQIEENLKGYKQQIGKIIDLDAVEWHYNSEWLAELTPRELDELAELFTVQQMLARRNFKDRFEKGEEISLREMHYPLYQGYDSVMIKADVEVGGSDQLFNMMAGRKIQERYGQKPQDVVATQMLLGLDGRKMSTSWGNVINILDEPGDMYGKLMSMSDTMMPDYAKLVARIGGRELTVFEQRVKEDPKGAKMMVARATVALYHGKGAAQKAEEEFERVHKQGQAPEQISKFQVSSSDAPLIDILVETKLVASKSEARRAIEQGGVKVDGVVVKDIKKIIELNKEGILIQKGKRGFVRVTTK
ncbi:tyrosine--tRNA ligase [Candidatus Uhrbacteria bacterium]|nr:tyrosine--tRNA ligase [Candidatus Uhrbacteria bacterium]